MTRYLPFLAALLLGVAAAQPQLTAYESASLAYRISYPSGWTFDATPDGDYLFIEPPEGSEAYGRVVIEVFVEELWHETLDAAIDELLDELREGFSSLHVLARSPMIGLGAAANLIDVRGSDATGQDIIFRIALALHEGRVYGLVLEAVSTEFAASEPLFDEMLATFTLLDRAEPVSSGSFDFKGRFLNDELMLTLEPSSIGGSAPGVSPFQGTLRYGGQDFPVTATHDARDRHLEGTFESAGSRFAFTTALSGDTLTFTTGGVDFELLRQVEHRPEPCNPLVPGSCGRSDEPELDFDYGLAAFQRGDFETAFAVFAPLADEGFAPAQFNLGVMHEHGLGVAQDYAEALRWYRPLAEAGHALARLRLGYMYEHGRSVPQDHVEAVRWIRLAAEQGEAQAQRSLGFMYFEGLGVAQDHGEAVRWWHLAAEQGERDALRNLGVAYEHGLGVAPDLGAASHWYRLAADQGCDYSREAFARLAWGR